MAQPYPIFAAGVAFGDRQSGVIQDSASIMICASRPAAARCEWRLRGAADGVRLRVNPVVVSAAGGQGPSAAPTLP